jgi:glucose/mannose-6-phosphate isomerase
VPRSKFGESSSRLRELLASLPQHLREGFRAGRSVSPQPSRAAPLAFSFGMGGSGIAAALVSSLVESETSTFLAVHRDSSLPRGIGRDSPCLFVSVSGGTRETLDAYDLAGRAGAPRWVICSGGELGRRAKTDGVPAVSVPESLRPPRSAAGYLFGAVLGVLDGYFSPSNAGRIESAASSLEKRWPTLSSEKSEAVRVAEMIGANSPVFYSGPMFEAVARRAATEVEENAKRIAAFDAIPESFHNALVGWDAIRPEAAATQRVVLFEWVAQSRETTARFEYLKELLRRKKVRCQSILLTEPDRLAALLEGVIQGDLVSLHLAERMGIDPLPVTAIDRMKSTLRDVV